MNEVDQVDLGGALFASFLVVILNRGKFPSQKQDLLDTDFSERARFDIIHHHIDLSDYNLLAVGSRSISLVEEKNVWSIPVRPPAISQEI